MVLVVALTAFLAAALTLFSGFGLGSLLLPAFAVFLPIHLAVAATALVHLANNLFKAGMMWRFADLRVVLVFGLPGMAASLLGALLLGALSGGEPLATWQLGQRLCEIRADGLAIGGLVLFFALFELHPRSRRIGFERRYLPLGGALSGFLGGLSGHQGALRSAFLLRQGLPKESYIGTGILCAVLVDSVRIPVYGISGLAELQEWWPAVLAGTLAAFTGSYLGRRLMHKVTMDSVHLLVGWLLAALGAAIAVGLV